VGKNSAAVRDLRIVEYDNPPIVRSRYPFEYESSSSPGLKTLRAEFELDSVIAKARSELEQFLLLRDWVSSRWDHGYCNVGRWSKTGLDYLRRAEKGECFTCAVYAFVLAEVLTATGFPARHITMAQANTDFIGPDVRNIGHCVVEVWSNQFRKWMVLDADAGSHFELNGIPLSALEVRSAWLRRKWRKVDFVRGKHIPRIVSMGPPGTPPLESLQEARKRFLRFKTMDYYRNLEFHMSNRHYSRHARPPVTLAWSDKDSPPRIVRQNVAVDPRVRITTENVNDIYYSLNHAYIRLHCPTWSKGNPMPLLEVRLETETPWFARFEARVNGAAWRKCRRSFRWDLRNGTNTLEVRPVNRFGRKGIVSRVAVLCRTE